MATLPDATSSVRHSSNSASASKAHGSRARVACRRCRRLRIRCIHDNGSAPCVACLKGGTAQDCQFPLRGGPDVDREFRQGRRKRVPSAALNSMPSTEPKATESSPVNLPVTSTPPTVTDRWDFLPPLKEVIDGCKVFGLSFFQLGFLPKAIFLERLAREPRSINVFFLLSILSISARFTPCLARRYGDGLKAAETFMDRATTLVPEEMYVPSLQNTQAFFLLAIAEWGKGDKTSSNIHMGIAIRMAGILRLHREETYNVSETATAEEIVEAEMARRTFWMLESQDNLHSGYTSPVSFSLGDVTTLLPCDESDFAFGNIPAERAALAGTLVAKQNPSLVHRASRSLFATLIQAHNLWGQIARKAVSNESANVGVPFRPWDSRSDYAQLTEALTRWEDQLPRRHRWSLWNLRGYKAEDLDLAYLSVTMVVRLSNIILRRSFLEDIIHSSSNDGAPDDFWKKMSAELFQNILGLHEQIEAFSALRSNEQGYPAMIVFCVYICGSLGNHLWKHPRICPDVAPRAESIVMKSLEVLADLQDAWPLARRWREALQRTASATQMELLATPPLTNRRPYPSDSGESQALPLPVSETVDNNPTSLYASLSLLAETAAHNSRQDAFTLDSAYVNQDPTLPEEIPQQRLNHEFDTELTAFLDTEGQLGFLYDWDQQLY